MPAEFGVEKALPSGASFVVGKTPFLMSYALFKAILRSFKGGLGESVDWKALVQKDVSVLLGVAIEAATSPDVDAALFACLSRCAWNKQAVVKDLFDDPTQGDAARADFVSMAGECVRVNCAPFFEGAFSGLKAAKAKVVGSPASS